MSCLTSNTGTAARWAPAEVTDLDPQPIHLRRGARLPERSVWVGRESRWANPFGWCGAELDRESRTVAVAQYGVWVAGRAELLAAARSALAGRDLACSCPLGAPCHRDVLLDLANPPANSFAAGGRAVGLTMRRPWGSLMLVPEELGGKRVENRSWATDYRGPVLLHAGTRVDGTGLVAAQRAGFDANWHANQAGWLGATVLVDVHPARRRCCAPWGHSGRPDKPCYHWVFRGAARLASPTFGRGFPGLRPVSWSVLVRRRALGVAPGVVG
jgi:hypothetical protein